MENSNLILRTTAAAHMVAGDDAVKVRFGAADDLARTDGNEIVLPTLTEEEGPLDHQTVEEYRAMLAHEAGHVKHTDMDAYRCLPPTARLIFNVLEDIRVESLVSGDYLGYGQDLRRSACRNAEALWRTLEGGSLTPIDQTLAALLVFHGTGELPTLSGPSVLLWQALGSFSGHFELLRLDPTREASARLAYLALNIAKSWAMECRLPEEPEGKGSVEKPRDSRGEGRRAKGGSVDPVAGADGAPEVDVDEEAWWTQETGAPRGAISAGQRFHAAEEPAGEASSMPAEPAPNERVAAYRPCLETDRVGPTRQRNAERFMEDWRCAGPHLPAVRRALRKALVQQFRPRVLGDQRRGAGLDSRALWRLAAVGDPRVFQRIIPGRQAEVAFALLVDESGSMRGRRIKVARQAAMLLSAGLESVGVPVTVLGHSTCERLPLRGQERVLVEGRLARGYTRADSLRLQVYKTFEEPWIFSRQRMATMAARNHNADGEAILHTARILGRRTEAHRHLLVLSDGVPECSGTSRQALAAHLRQAVEQVTREGQLVTGIGIQTESVADFYPTWELIDDLENLAPALTRLVAEALKASVSAHTNCTHLARAS